MVPDCAGLEVFSIVEREEGVKVELVGYKQIEFESAMLN